MLDLMVAHDKYGEINLSLEKTADDLVGSWLAPGFVLSGEGRFELSENFSVNDSAANVRGSYRGLLNWDWGNAIYRGYPFYDDASYPRDENFCIG